MEIRSCKNLDNKSLGEIYDLCRPDEFYGEPERHKTVQWFDEPFIQDNICHANILAGEIDGKVVGFCGSRSNHVYWLFVLPGHRKKGMARRLLNEPICNMRGKITLFVWSSNVRAKSRYISCGFEQCERKMVDYYGKSLSLDTMALER